MKRFAAVTVLITCFVGRQVIGQYVVPQQGDLYAAASDQFAGSGFGQSYPNYGGNIYSSNGAFQGKLNHKIF